MDRRRLTRGDILRRFSAGERLAMVTAYDYTSARLADAAEIPLLLVGDSVGMVVQGRDTTRGVTLDQLVYHSACVARGVSSAHIVTDLPFLSYVEPTQTLLNAGRLLTEGDAQTVKLEGGARVAPLVETLVQHGIPVMGHVGFTPQSSLQIGVKVQGKTVDDAVQLVRDCRALQEAGAWAIVLELIPADVAAYITDELSIPTIGIGAGAACDGEVQVWHDILGLYPDFLPRHARHFADAGACIAEGLRQFRDDVANRVFPNASHASALPEGVLADVRRQLEAEA